MISNISNALPVFLKKIKSRNPDNNETFNLLDSLKFYNSILPTSSELIGLKHLYVDVVFKITDKYPNIFNTFLISVDTISFLKEFSYILDSDNNTIIIRGNMEEFAIFSLIMLGSIKNIGTSDGNKSIFISMVKSFLIYCLHNEYKVCEESEIELLDEYNSGFEEEFFENIYVIPTDEKDVASFHFIGIELNKDILVIFEKYKNIKFSYNSENSAFVITMAGKDWDDFWSKAPAYLKDEFVENK